MGRAAIFNSDYLQSGAYAASVFREVDRLIEKESPMLRLSEVAKRLRVSVRTVQNMIADGRLRAFNFGNANELPERMAAMCQFANQTSSDPFIHPAVRAMILHFWLAYDHPFVDGNGRTARALFYWAMLRSGYWLFEFVSISNILRKAPAKYARSFLYTETDDNDLTYFLVAQSRVIRQAIQSLHDYIKRKTDETREVESRLRSLDALNHRQVEVILHALKHPGYRYTVASHQRSHNVVYQTARTDLLDLQSRGLFEMSKQGKTMVFGAAKKLAERLRKIE